MITKECIEILMLSIMLLVIIGIFLQTILNKKVIGARVIQFSCITFLIPVILILSFEGILNGETIDALLGGFAGYFLSGISNFDNPLKDKAEYINSK